jgi:hypothetical protein
VKNEDRATFARTVWAEFGILSGQKRLISPAEFALLARWMDASIPLPVILRAFGEFKGTPRVLLAMEHPVARAFEYYRKAMAL